MPDTACDIAWITVTAARNGPAYSARSMCTQTRTGLKEAPSYLLITPLTGRHIAGAQADWI